MPSGNSVAALNLLRLAEFTLDAEYHERAALLLSAFHDTLERSPVALSVMLMAVDFVLDSPFEIVIVTPPDGRDPGAKAMLSPLRKTFVPNRIVSVVQQGETQSKHVPLVPLVKGKIAQKNRTTAYVCVDQICSYPTSDPQRFAKQISQVEPLARARPPESP